MIAFDRSDESSDGEPAGMNLDIYVMGSDGSDPTQLTSDPAFEAAPTWSPDGTRIAFIGLIDSSAANVRKSELFTMRPDGSDLTPLTTGASTGYSPNGFAAPSWTIGSVAGEIASQPTEPSGVPPAD